MPSGIYKRKPTKLKIGRANTKHGINKNDPIYVSWSNMKARCSNKNSKSYRYYGAKGIKVCDRWLNFKNFYDDMYSTWSNGMTLDRINSDMDYTPQNCRWADRTVQNNNKSNNRRFYGKTLAEWSKELNIKKSTLYQRYHAYNWDIDKVLNTPIGKRG